MKTEARTSLLRPIINDAIHDRLMAKAAPYRRTGDYKSAIRAIRQDKDYLAHALELKALNLVLKKWERLANEQ